MIIENRDTDFQKINKYKKKFGMAPNLPLIRKLFRFFLRAHSNMIWNILISPHIDASGLKDAEAVRGCQEKVVHALQEYTVSHYPDLPSKFGELLLRMPELSRVCQVGKEMLCLNQQSDCDQDKQTPGFNLLMELLRDDQ